MARPKVAETELGKVVVAHLAFIGASEIWQEVEVPLGVADIVARVGAELWIVELKTSLSLALLVQAMARRRLAHRVIVAAPHSKNMRDVAALCGELGIGLWNIRLGDGTEWGPSIVREEIHGQRWNRRPVDLAARLTDGHKTHAAAGAVGGGGRWTPFRSTCEQLVHLVARAPGVTLKSAIDEITHHYRTKSSARSSLAHWITRGKVPGVELRDGALYPASEAPAVAAT